MERKERSLTEGGEKIGGKEKAPSKPPPSTFLRRTQSKRRRRKLKERKKRGLLINPPIFFPPVKRRRGDAEGKGRKRGTDIASHFAENPGVILEERGGGKKGKTPPRGEKGRGEDFTFMGHVYHFKPLFVRPIGKREEKRRGRRERKKGIDTPFDTPRSTLCARGEEGKKGGKKEAS